MSKVFFILCFSTALAYAKAGYADPELPNMLENAANNGNGFAFAWSGGWPADIYPQNTFFGGPTSVGEFLQNLRKQQEQFDSGGAFSISFSSSSGTSTSQAHSSISFGGEPCCNILNWASQVGPGSKPFSSIPGLPKDLGRDSEGAYAGAAIGPSGVYQTAQLFPENPNSPNIETRFAANNPQDGGNFFAVATSSQSESKTVDGKTTGSRKASTTINNNGKVTTYTAHDP